MFSLSSRLVQAHEVSNPVQHVDTEQQIAGRKSEEEFVEMVIKHGVAYPGDVYRRLRVPDNFQTQRHEIDVVFITGEGLHIIEIKNWGGEITVSKDGETWEQRKRTKKSTHIQISHPNPVHSTSIKSNLLRSHLMKAGICIRERNFIHKVVLMNTKCKLDESISSNPAVVTHSKLQEYFDTFKQTISTKLTSPVIPYFITGSLSYSQMEQCRIALGQIGTWDVIELNGGRSLTGDYIGCAELSCDRKDIEKMIFVHQRNATLSTLWAVLGYEPTTVVSLYKRNTTSWFGPAVSATIVIPYNKDVKFQIAGESAHSKIPANEIKCIVLSN